MNREIKFRYWNAITNQMVINPEMPYKQGWTIEQLFSDRGWVWQQFTGLHDKNGKEIYEGDIVRFEKNGFNPMIDTDRAEVIFAEGGFVFNAGRFNYRNEPDYIHFGFWKDPAKCGLEVIGNIYQNKDLIN
jgi:uncharacterized phage protein (TIGR01671 family)